MTKFIVLMTTFTIGFLNFGSAFAEDTEPKPTYHLNKACVRKVFAMSELLGMTFKTPKLNPNAKIEVVVDEYPETLEDMGFTKVKATVKLISTPEEVAANDYPLASNFSIRTVTSVMDLGDDCHIMQISSDLDLGDGNP